MHAPSLSFGVLRATAWLFVGVLAAAGAGAMYELTGDLLDIIVQVARTAIAQPPF